QARGNGAAMTSRPPTPSHACADGDANCRLQKRAAIVSRLFFTMKIPTPTCGAQTTCSERSSAMGGRGPAWRPMASNHDRPTTEPACVNKHMLHQRRVLLGFLFC